ncbi:MAG: aminotransferase class I/II-fold pyridoxal phosphate-dependent enzyme [Myxococcota bacterium]
MPLERFTPQLRHEVEQLDAAGTTKRREPVVRAILAAKGAHGPRFLLEGHGETPFIRMSSNSYLGLSLRKELRAAEEKGAQAFGVGPGAVRFISGSYAPHIELEQRLARFHGRDACMITSAAYTSMLGVVVTLTTPETVIVSDELNHNCIINAMKLARPKDKRVYRHLDVHGLERELAASVGNAEAALVITDGIFSMRGDLAPLDVISDIVRKYDDKFPRGAVLVVDDSHGVGGFGRTGRGTEEYTGAKGIDILVATLGKAFGVNGGYIVSSQPVIDYLREKNPLYIYTNPITPSEATAALAALDIVESPEGEQLLTHLRAMTKRFEDGIVALGYETIPSEHPVVPLLVRDTEKTGRLVRHLRAHGVLATGLNYPVVPKGDELIRFQVAADHTPADIDVVLAALASFK